MNPLLIPVIGDVVGKVGQLADDLFTSDEERARAGIDAYKAETERMQGQVEINKIEAGHRSLFVAGWRPAVGWVGVVAMAYQFVLYPLLTWGWSAMQAAGWISIGLLPPPQLDTESLWVILTGILGLGAYRSAEKIKGRA
jgi:hypothetical protein